MPPDEARLRALFLQIGNFSLAFFWSIFIVQQILVVYQLFITGIPLKVINQFAHHRVSPAAIILIVCLIIYALVVCLLCPEIKRALRECFELQGFSRLYYACSCSGPTKRPLRFSQSVVLPSDVVTYTYSNSSFLLVTEEKVKALPVSVDAQEVVESSVVIAEPSTASVEVTVPAIAPQLEATTPTLPKDDQEPSSYGLPGTKPYLLITLEQGEIRISIAIVINTKLVEVVRDIIKHPRRKALIVYLATRKGRARVKRESILTDVYGEDSVSTQELFYQDVHRIRKVFWRQIHCGRYRFTRPL
jgi:hypothetical protein